MKVGNQMIRIRQYSIFCLWYILMCNIFSCTSFKKAKYIISKQEVVVDGTDDEWDHIEGNLVDDPDQLWIGQDLVAENWTGRNDLWFEWKASWYDNKIYFLFLVQDDILVEPATQPNSFLNDCIEIMLDTKNTEGPRFTETGKGRVLHGYEMHFLPAAPNHVFLNDSLAPMYPLEMSQDSLFKTKWKGEIACTNKPGTYIVEIGFEVPDLIISPGVIVGMDVDVCDDDGEGRKSLMIWSGVDNEFWLTMDKYPKVIFK